MNYPQQGYGGPGGFGGPPGGFGGPQSGYNPSGGFETAKKSSNLGTIFGFAILGLGVTLTIIYIVSIFVDFTLFQFLTSPIVSLAAGLIYALSLLGKNKTKYTTVIAALSVAAAIFSLLTLINILTLEVPDLSVDGALIKKGAPTSYIVIAILVFVFSLIQAGLAVASVFFDKGEELDETSPAVTPGSPYAGPRQTPGTQPFEAPGPQYPPGAPQGFQQAPGYGQQYGQAGQQGFSQQYNPVQAPVPSPYAPVSPQVPVSAPPSSIPPPAPAPASPYGIPAAGTSGSSPSPAGPPQGFSSGGETHRAH